MFRVEIVMEVRVEDSGRRYWVRLEVVMARRIRLVRSGVIFERFRVWIFWWTSEPEMFTCFNPSHLSE